VIINISETNREMIEPFCNVKLKTIVSNEEIFIATKYPPNKSANRLK